MTKSESQSRNPSRPTTPNSAKLSLYNYQPIKTQTNAVQLEKPNSEQKSNSRRSSLSSEKDKYFQDNFQQIVPHDPLLIQPQVIRMDTFAITTFNSSDDNNSDDDSFTFEKIQRK